MKEFLKSLDNLPLLVKLILCIPAIHIVWGIYRIISALDAGNAVALIIHIILLFIPIMWIVDFVMILLTDNVLKLA
jgi:hypothetical protein